METTKTIRPIRTADAGTEPQSARKGKSHGDAVVEAITWPTRFLMAGVIGFNLSLGAWLIHQADFSGVSPQGSEAATAAHDPHDEGGRDALFAHHDE